MPRATACNENAESIFLSVLSLQRLNHGSHWLRKKKKKKKERKKKRKREREREREREKGKKKERGGGIEGSFCPFQSNPIALADPLDRHLLYPSLPPLPPPSRLRVGKLELFNLRNRDRQYWSARCSTSTIIRSVRAGNFVRSTCVLAQSPPPPPPSSFSFPTSCIILASSSSSSSSSLQPALIHIAIHPPCAPLSRRCRAPFNPRAPNL